jgi:hypothetical protein
MIGALREILKKSRERYVVATGPYNLLFGHTDVFLFLGVFPHLEAHDPGVVA